MTWSAEPVQESGKKFGEQVIGFWSSKTTGAPRFLIIKPMDDMEKNSVQE